MLPEAAADWLAGAAAGRLAVKIVLANLTRKTE
jgi:hypothetical protein